MTYRLYGYSLSYFTRKLECALTWYGLPFTFEIKGADIKAMIESKAGTHQVPVLETPDGEWLSDTTPLMWRLDDAFPHARMFPQAPVGAVVQLVEEYLDEWIPRCAMNYRWQYPESAAFAAEKLGYESAPAASALVGQMIASWGQKSCRAIGVSEPETARLAESTYEELLVTLDDQLKTTRYTMGERPCAVDAVVLGGLLGHFAQDPIPAAQVAKHPRVVGWISEALNWDGQGEWVPFPELTSFAQWVLARMSGDFSRFLMGNMKAMSEGQKSFICDTSGHATSYLARRYPEDSRQMAVKRINALAQQFPDVDLQGWLMQKGLDEVFGR